MKPLTNDKYWDARHCVSVREGGQQLANRRGLRRVVDWARNRLGAETGSSYADYLCERKLLRHLPRSTQSTVLELGCAPGRRLLRLCDLFGYVPYGVEYSAVGVEAARAAFAERGIPPEQVIASDLFSPQFQEQYKGCFDVVFSNGLIEHFDKPEEVTAIHAALVKPGGYLFCSIPNLRGPAYPFFRYGASDVLAAHNCRIMQLPVFRSLFENIGLTEEFCGPVGQFSLIGLASLERPGMTGRFFHLVSRVESLANHLMFLVQRGRAIETRWSPCFLYIGRKAVEAGTKNEVQIRDAGFQTARQVG